MMDSILISISEMTTWTIGDSGMYFPLDKVEYLNFLKKKGPYNSSEIISLTFVCKIKSYVGEKTENTVRLFGRLSG